MTGWLFIPGVTAADLANDATMTAALDNATYWPAGTTTFCGINTAGLMFQLSASTALTPVPLGLFASGALGGFYDPSNLATLFQDVAGTVPVTTYGQSVARMLDRSGLGYHATQANAAKRPVYAREPKVGTRNRANGSANVTGTTLWDTSNVSNGLTATKIGQGIDVDGLPYVDCRWQGTATGVFATGTLKPASTAVASGAGVTFTASVKVKLIAGTLTGVTNVAVLVQESNGGTLYSTSDHITPTATETALVATRTKTDPANAQMQAQISLAVVNGATVDMTLRIKALQFEAGAAATAYQANYSMYDVTEAGVADVYYLYSDQVDDSLPATVPDLGSNATVWDARGTGANVLAAQTVGAGAFETLRGAKTYAVGVIGRALTGPETTALTAHLQQKRISP